MNIPLAQRRGRVRFMGLDLLVEPGTLVPRVETELLCTAAIDALRALDIAEPRVIDLCCGSGNLACAIAHHLPRSRVRASDISARCAALARRNVEALGLAERVSIYEGDLFDALSGSDFEQGIDAIVCNPPYISEKKLEREAAHLLEWEPREAFAAGPYGISIHARVIKRAPDFLRAGGVLLIEIGAGQERQVHAILDRAKAYERIEALHDATGATRVMRACRMT